MKNDDMKPGDPCPDCSGKVYKMKNPGVLIRFFGQPPVKAAVWELEKFRCNLCGAVFTAEPPETAKGEKYDETAIAIMALSRYGFGMPFNRLENLQGCLQIPLPASTQWDKVESGADKIYPVFEQLIRESAQGKILFNDDTNIKVLELIGQNRMQVDGRRKGMFTTGIVSELDDKKTALFFTGRGHAGENIANVLNRRESRLPPPIQMCDALSRNSSVEPNVILTHCNAHSRRKFVEVADSFPDECLHVLNVFEKIYVNDAKAKKADMSDRQRLEYHREQSGPTMSDFHRWMTDKLENKEVEPYSSLGEAISYTLEHWTELTRFLNTEGAPLDNNICERALKKAILHRRNSLFYETLHGAYIGDMYMSLIHTCNLNGINPFKYLTDLQIHSSELFENPADWMPWNYESAMSKAAE